MKDIIHTLLTAQERSLLFRRFRELHWRSLKGKDQKADTLVGVIFDFFDLYGEVPTPYALAEELTAANQHDMVDYLSGIVGEGKPRASEELSEFSAAASRHARASFQKDMDRASSDMQQMLVTVNSGGLDASEFLDTQISQLRQLRSKYAKGAEAISDSLFGHQSKEESKSRYFERKRKTQNGEIPFFDLGLGPSFDSVLIEKGDMITFGGYTSHGKSIHLRRLCYYYAINYGMNIPFLTFEMNKDKVKDLFFIRHANNKQIFPNTPKISSFKHKTGTLTEEQEHFLFDVVAEDFTTNENYGTIEIIQPTKVGYSLDDLAATLTTIETETMPIDAVGLDYLTMMTPKGNPNHVDASQVNRMIKDFKAMLLTHKNAKGELSPIIGITAHQISRGGLDAALKNDRIYESKAFHMHSEIEKSSDWLFTTLMTGEMKENNENRLQALKGRDGAIPYDPVDLYMDLEHGFTINQAVKSSEADIIDSIASLDI